MRSKCHGEGNGADATAVETATGISIAAAMNARRRLLTILKANGEIFSGSAITEEVLLL
jgi:hypothetical protein